MRFLLFSFLFFCFAFGLKAQQLGGRTLFPFTKVSGSPQLTALGGINVSQFTKDIGLSFQNPALLTRAQEGQAQFVFDSYLGNIRQYQVMTGHYLPKQDIMIGGGLQFFDYGRIQQTDAAGNILGNFRPVDYLVQVMVSRRYMERWNYGFTLKFMHSAYGAFRASGLALDAGIVYTDTSRGLQVGWTAINMGTALKRFAGTENREMPFDMRLGVSKKLANAPIQFSITAHHLHQFNILYDDSTLPASSSTLGVFGEKVFRHFVLGAQFFIGERIELSAGYNYLRRKELNAGSAGNGLNGFSMGVGVLIKKLQLRYARTYLQGRQSNNQIGLSLFFTSAQNR